MSIRCLPWVAQNQQDMQQNHTQGKSKQSGKARHKSQKAKMKRNKQKIEKTIKMERTNERNNNDEKIYLKITTLDMQSYNHHEHSMDLKDRTYIEEKS